MDAHLSWRCLCCAGEIPDDPARTLGVSLDESPELHVCLACWLDQFTPAERLEICRRWRFDRRTGEALDAVAELCHAAMSGWSFPGGLAPPGHN